MDSSTLEGMVVAPCADLISASLNFMPSSLSVLLCSNDSSGWSEGWSVAATVISFWPRLILCCDISVYVTICTYLMVSPVGLGCNITGKVYSTTPCLD